MPPRCHAPPIQSLRWQSKNGGSASPNDSFDLVLSLIREISSSFGQRRPASKNRKAWENSRCLAGLRKLDFGPIRQPTQEYAEPKQNIALRDLGGAYRQVPPGGLILNDAQNFQQPHN